MSREVCGICWCPYDEFTGDCACPPANVQKSTLREAAQAMLRALEHADVDPHSSDAVYTAMAALKAALAEPEPLQQALVEADRIMGHDGDATEWRERWAWLFPQRQAEPVPPCATRECMPSECPNCASLEAQNTELDRKLAEMERKPLTEDVATELVRSVVSNSPRPIGMVEYGMLVARAIERAHGIGGSDE